MTTTPYSEAGCQSRHSALHPSCDQSPPGPVPFRVVVRKSSDPARWEARCMVTRRVVVVVVFDFDPMACDSGEVDPIEGLALRSAVAHDPMRCLRMSRPCWYSGARELWGWRHLHCRQRRNQTQSWAGRQVPVAQLRCRTLAACA